MFKVKEGIELFGNAYLRHPTGNYGSVEIDGGATGSWEGYSIGGRAVFMHDNSTGTGLYNDVNNHWLFRGIHGGASHMYYNGGLQLSAENGYALAKNQMRAPIFYDANNTTYYLDPANSGTALKVRGKIILEQGNTTAGGIELNSVKDSTWPFEFTTNDVGNDNSSGFWVGSNGYPDMRLRREDGTVRALISSWERSYTTYGLTDSTDMRAPIFYDNNDTSYYCNPNSTSNFANLTLAGTTNIGPNNAYKDITVNGDANTYYPVTIHGHGKFAFQRYSISRSYSWTAPSTWNTSTHKGGLTLTWEWSGDSAWGGNDKTMRVVQFAESYTTMVGGMQLAVSGGSCVVWLRGGGAKYRIHGPAGNANGVTIYLDGFTGSNGTVYSPRTSPVTSEIYSRMPIQGDGTGRLDKLAIAGNDHTSGYGLDMYDGVHMHNNDINYVSQLHFQDNVRFYDNGDDRYLNYKWGNSTAGGIKFLDGNSTVHGYIYGEGAGEFGLLDNDGSWAVRVRTGTNPLELRCDNNAEFYVHNSYTYSPGSSRAPIFYDSNNTAFYTNPASTSNLSDLQVAGQINITGTSGSAGFNGKEVYRPVGAYWGAAGNTTGAVWIKLPGTASQYDMVNIEIDVYDYSATAGTKIYVSGHNWTTGWANANVQMVGPFAGEVKLLRGTNGYYIKIGNNTQAWSYGTVQVTKVTTASFYDVINWKSGWSITQSSTGPESIYQQSTGNLNSFTSKTIQNYASIQGYYAHFSLYYDTNNTAYYCNPGSTSNFSNLSIAGTLTETSDIRLKSDIQKIDNALDKVQQLSGYTYNMKDVETRKTGVIAQEVEKVLPEAVTGESTKSVAYGNMVGLLIEAIKEQQTQIETLKSEIQSLKGTL